MYFPREIIKDANIIVYTGAYGINEYDKYFKASPEKVKEFVDIYSKANATETLKWFEKHKHEFIPMAKGEILIYKQGKADGMWLEIYRKRREYGYWERRILF